MLQADTELQQLIELFDQRREFLHRRVYRCGRFQIDSRVPQKIKWKLTTTALQETQILA